MARIRTIKPEFFRHEGLYEAEQKEKLPLRLAFIGLWTAADKEGRFKWQPRALKLDCLPYEDCDFSRVLDALATRGFIQKYEHEGQFYGVIPSWKAHQVINNRETESTLPDPHESTILTREARVDDATGTRLKHAQGEGKGREGKGKGKEGEGRVDDFDIFWKAYPKKTGIDDARRAFAKRNVDGDLLNTMLAAIEAQSASSQWKKDDGQFIPNPSTWLNQGRWQDQVFTGRTAADNEGWKPPELRGANEKLITAEVLQ